MFWTAAASVEAYRRQHGITADRPFLPAILPKMDGSSRNTIAVGREVVGTIELS